MRTLSWSEEARARQRWQTRRHTPKSEAPADPRLRGLGVMADAEWGEGRDTTGTEDQR